MQISNEEIDKISAVNDKFPNISSVKSKVGSQQGRACIAHFPL